MLQQAQKVVITAIDAGWTGPPFDPISLGESMGLEILANESVKDARTVPTEAGLRIEFNPNRPRPRIRYSIAHEIGHTLFPDCRAYVRNRSSYHELHGDDWQIESLCNIAAAEFLMPVGSLPEIGGQGPEIDTGLALREQFQVSVEAVLIRMVRSWEGSAAMFAASYPDDPQIEGQYRLDYIVGSPSWRVALPKGSSLPLNSLVTQCTAVGFTAKGIEAWSDTGPKLRVECVAIPPYPGSQFPRVVGVLKQTGRARDRQLLTYLVGDATSPRGNDPKVIAHIVNDATSNWGGGGFAQFVRRKWPHVQQEFKIWAASQPLDFSLGHVHSTQVQTNLWMVHMIAQRGYGPSVKPRIQYEALQSCLRQTAHLATELNAKVHMPRIGTGQARGQWSVIEDLVRTELCERDIEVIVYDPAGSDPALRTPTLPGILDS
jgi:hypothetical protein